MDIRMLAFYLALLAVLSSAATAASPTASSLMAGEVQLTFSSDRVSAFPIDVQALAEALCGPAGKGTANVASCRLTVPLTQTPLSVLRIAILPPDSSLDDSSLPVQWQVTGMDLAVDSVVSSCGVWEISLSLDGTGPQPLSSMILMPELDDPGHGLFAGILEMKALLHLANSATEHAFDYPLTFGFSLEGPWRLVTPDEADVLAPGASYLRPFTDEQDKCVSGEILADPALLEKYLAQGCEICIKRLDGPVE